MTAQTELFGRKGNPTAALLGEGKGTGTIKLINPVLALDLPGTIHYAKLENSPRLQRLLSLLQDRQPHTTMDIINQAKICAVNSAICELRKNGFDILCKPEGRNEAGSNVYSYQLIGRE